MSRTNRETALPFILKEIISVDRIEDCNFLSKKYLLVDGEVVVCPSLTKIWTNGIYVFKSKSPELATNPFFCCLIKAYTAMMFSPILAQFFLWLAMTSKGHWVSDAELKREAYLYTKAYGITETTYSMNVKEAIERAHGIG